AAVAAPHVQATEAGRAILAEGGNAIEAMVAMAATIAVVYPHMNSIGGDGFWLIGAPGGRVRAIEACGFAGRGATIARYRQLGGEAIPSRGAEAALTVPGTIGGWRLALQLSASQGGRIPLADLLGNAVRLAREGYPISASEARTIPIEYESLREAPGFAETHLHDGKPPKLGEIRRAAAIAETLDHLARAGLDDFYRGDVGREIAADLARMRAPVTREDLAAYRAQWREPLSTRLNDATLFNTPPPTQGLASLMLLGLFERLDVRRRDEFAHFHGLIEATRRALAARDRICVDFDDLKPDWASVLAPEALDREAATISRTKASSLDNKPAEGGTVWMGAIDAAGRAVSFIQSSYWEYGSGCVLPTTGVLMSNRGLAFSLDPSSPNRLRPGRRPFHTLNTPLAYFDDGRIVSHGAMGGDGQPQFQAQVLTGYRFGGKIAEALAAPRFLVGRTWGASSSTVKLEGDFDDGVAQALAKAGHPIERTEAPHSDLFGHAGMLARSGKGAIEAAHDPRSDGAAAGF
ncbi:MAG TPA: gamma-glutamyltransferase, partial [Roseiarcus sp.]|nr:gamma-glutamyltransferase [Roseiarcus sp.]